MSALGRKRTSQPAQPPRHPKSASGKYRSLPAPELGGAKKQSEALERGPYISLELEAAVGGDVGKSCRRSSGLPHKVMAMPFCLARSAGRHCFTRS